MKPQITYWDRQTPAQKLDASKELRHEAADHVASSACWSSRTFMLQRSCGMKPQITPCSR